jgi:hypothetical protein
LELSGYSDQSLWSGFLDELGRGSPAERALADATNEAPQASKSK